MTLTASRPTSCHRCPTRWGRPASSQSRAAAGELDGSGVSRSFARPTQLTISPSILTDGALAWAHRHYRSDDAWAFQEMSGDFHRKVMRLENR